MKFSPKKQIDDIFLKRFETVKLRFVIMRIPDIQITLSNAFQTVYIDLNKIFSGTAHCQTRNNHIVAPGKKLCEQKVSDLISKGH